MNDQRLEQLLRQAADATPAPTVPDDLALQVRLRRCRRMQGHPRRVLAAAAAVWVIIGAIGIFQFTGTTNHQQFADNQDATNSGVTGVPPVEITSQTKPCSYIVPPGENLDPEMEALRAKIASLESEIVRLQNQMKVEKAQRRYEQSLAALRRELAKPDPRDLIAEEYEKTAFLMVRRGEECEKTNRPDEARREYQQVVNLYPETSWAKTAQAKLIADTSLKGEK